MKKIVLITIFFLLIAVGVGASKSTKLKIGGGKITLQQLADVQPGAGSIMPLIGKRATIAYYAAKAGKWKLAEYELDELGENAEVIEVTRPKHKKGISHFLKGKSFKRLKSAAKKKNMASFQTNFDKTVKACNSCHKSSKKSFIIYKLPKTQPEVPFISD